MYDALKDFQIELSRLICIGVCDLCWAPSLQIAEELTLLGASGALHNTTVRCYTFANFKLISDKLPRHST